MRHLCAIADAMQQTRTHIIKVIAENSRRLRILHRESASRSGLQSMVLVPVSLGFCRDGDAPIRLDTRSHVD
jgi:hypothetical protein